MCYYLIDLYDFLCVVYMFFDLFVMVWVECGFVWIVVVLLGCKLILINVLENYVCVVLCELGIEWLFECVIVIEYMCDCCMWCVKFDYMMLCWMLCVVYVWFVDVIFVEDMCGYLKCYKCLGIGMIWIIGYLFGYLLVIGCLYYVD